MSRPWMPLYVSDYLGDTQHLSVAEHGAYMLLTMQYWQLGHLPNDDDRLARIAAGMPIDEWRKMRPTIQAFFHDGWRHAGLDRELTRQRIFIDGWAETRKRIFERDNYTCQYCGQRGGDLQCDHVHPYSRGGSSKDENLATACKPCNQSKKDKTLEEWRQ